MLQVFASDVGGTLRAVDVTAIALAGIGDRLGEMGMCFGRMQNLGWRDGCYQYAIELSPSGVATVDEFVESAAVVVTLPLDDDVTLAGLSVMDCLELGPAIKVVAGAKLSDDASWSTITARWLSELQDEADSAARTTWLARIAEESLQPIED